MVDGSIETPRGDMAGPLRAIAAGGSNELTSAHTQLELAVLMRGARRATLLAAAAMAVLSLGGMGCGDCYGGRIDVTTRCSDMGSATLESPDGVAVMGALEVHGTCDGSCESAAEFTLLAVPTAGSGAVPLGFFAKVPVRNKPGKPPFTVDIGPGSGARGSFTLFTNPGGLTADLSIVEGSVVVRGRTRSTFEATFSATVVTPAGERLIIRNGIIEVSGCSEQSTCTNT
jgi:hypothetical protein